MHTTKKARNGDILAYIYDNVKILTLHSPQLM